MNKKTAVQPLSENTKKAIIITAIVVLAVIILSIALALILKPTPLTPSTETPPTSESSTLPIKNGDFQYASSDDTAYPKTAMNWTKYGYKEATSSSSHDFATINTTDKAVMGIVDTNADNWAEVAEDLANAGIVGVTNPGLRPDLESDEDNVYMIATKQATAASILSDSTSISSGKSVKISIWLNTAQLAEGTKAVVMIQKSTVSAKAENWYAYNFDVEKGDGWQEFTFYIFNREASTKYIRVSIGIGNVYSGEEGLPLVGANENEPITGEGILFVDDITYEEVTADAYRQVVDAEGAEDSTLYKIIENEDITDDSIYLPLKKVGDGAATFAEFDNSADLVADIEYSPFTTRDDFVVPEDESVEQFTVYKVSNTDLTLKDAIGFRLECGQLTDIASSLFNKDHHHISFWVKVNQGNKVAKANVYVQQVGDDGDWEDVSNGSWTSITTSQDVETDSNCGWVKYDIYIKPTSTNSTVSILFVLGNKDGYSEDEVRKGLVPNGNMYITKPAYENISYKDYNNASSGSYVKKLDLIGGSATTSVTNGSFSTINNTGTQPSSWTPTFAGDNNLYRDGLGNQYEDKLTRLAKDIDGSGVLKNWDGAPNYDDEQRNVLQIVNNVATSFGFYSNDITLSARTAYVFSVLVKGNPYIYLLNTDTSLDRADRVVASVTSTSDKHADDALYGQTSYTEEGDGWVRYYFLVVTKAESQTVRIALFNGSLDATQCVTGTVYYDAVTMQVFGTYSLVDDDEIPEGEEATNYKVEWNSNSNFEKKFDELTKEDLEGIVLVQPTEEEWNEITLIPEKVEEEDPGTSNGTTEKEPRHVDWALLFSVISSIALVAALLVVIVVKIFRNRSKNNRRPA